MAFARRLVDSMLRPNVTDFVFQHALRSSPETVIEGATIAAQHVSKALVRDEDGGIGVDALLQAGLVDGELHGEVDRVRQRSASGNFFREARGAARLSNVKLVLGPDRARAKDLDLNRLELGDCLVVLGREADDFLYSQATQQRILGESGCTVQLDFVFEDRDDPAYFPQTYTFETSLSARHLNVDGDGEPVREDDYKFVVADVNHVLQGNAYWATARDYAPGLRGIFNALG